MRDNRRRNPKNVEPIVIPCMFSGRKENGFAGTKRLKDNALFYLGFLLIIRSLFFCYNSLFTRSYQLLLLFYSHITKKAKTKK